MASTWDTTYMHAILYEDFQEHFKDAQENSIVTYFRGLVNACGKASSYQDSLQIILSAWDFVGQQSGGNYADQISIFASSLARASREVVLSGDWSQSTDKVAKNKMEQQVKKVAGGGSVGAREGLQSLLSLIANPWDSNRIKDLLGGKTEQQQQVLELVSTEGVDCVLLRTELLVEAGLDKPAYRFVSNVTNSLLADHIVFESYVLTSRPGSLERLVDLFLALALATRHEGRLYKVLRLLGLEQVNSVYMGRFEGYLQYDPEKPGDASRVSPGRCGRLFTPLVSGKVIKVCAQWSIAGAAVMECSDELQRSIISRWLKLRLGDTVQDQSSFQSDIETLVKSASQTTFLYRLAHQLSLISSQHRLGTDSELPLKMFIKGLTSDLNASEASRKNKTKKAEIEKRMAEGFWLLSQVVGEQRLSLLRECVLTGFSIYPTQEGLDRIRELARISGLDKVEEPEDENQEEEMTEEPLVSGLHCRVPADKSKRNRFTKMSNRKGKDRENYKGSVLAAFCLLDREENDWGEKLGSLLQEVGQEQCGRAQTKLRNTHTKKKKFRNLEGLLSIQGELITEASNYNPVAMPCPSLSSENLGLSKTVTDDLITVVSAPRWHSLSWVMDWSELEGTCLRLLADPSIRQPKDELKFLNIDYTQFDEWSSDEEVTIYTGIEKGYEKWVEMRSEDDRFSEHGLSSGDEAIEFNAQHTSLSKEYDDSGLYIHHEDYKAEYRDAEILDTGTQGTVS